MNDRGGSKGKNYSFFSHKDCEFFPCQKIDGEFNCLFCYCPLYAFGDNCGGNPVRLQSGIKSCEYCDFPHKPENYYKVLEKLSELGAKRLTIYIDGKKTAVREGQTVLDAALSAGIYIPHLCSHPDLTPQGGCKLCVVEINDDSGAVCACKTRIADGMRVTTKTDELNHIRRVALELMLAAHPHECTGCRSYGACELQTLMQYLSVVPGRMKDIHKQTLSINRKNPLIDREPERCILCGRCVRVCKDIRGVGVLEYREKDGEAYVGTKDDLPLKEADCRFCGACVAVCPTGALNDADGIFRTDLPREDALVPCRAECPAHTDIPKYLRFARDGKYADAVAVLREKLTFPHSLGYICSRFCEKGCKRRGLDSCVSIRDIKRLCAERDKTAAWRENIVKREPTGKRVAVIGAGPCGLTAAYYLAMSGHAVKVFDKNPVAGGMLATGIPAYRLPRDIVAAEIDIITEMGVEIALNIDIKDISGLLPDFDAVVVAAGASEGRIVPLSGCEPMCLSTAIEFLREVALTGVSPRVTEGVKVVVIGGGNAAFDAARTAVRLGASVSLVCPESREHMLADAEEIEEGEREGVHILSGRECLRFTAENGKLTGLVTVDISGFAFEQGRMKTERVEGSEKTIAADFAIFAVGQRAVPLQGDDMTGVFRAGDYVYGTKSVVHAIAAGRRAAEDVDKFLGGTGVVETELSPQIIPSGKLRPEDGSDASRCLQCDLRLQLQKTRLYTAYTGVAE